MSRDLLHDIEMDHFYRQQRKTWHFPKFYRYKVADKRWFHPLLNRYPHHIVGAAIVVGQFAYCVLWAKLKP